jgi:hypothetical protein
VTGVAKGAKRRGRPHLTEEQAADRATRIIDIALALWRGVSDAELRRRWALTRHQAVALVEKRQRHPRVAAFIGTTLQDLNPNRNLLVGAARYALQLVEANPQMTLTAAIALAAKRVRVVGQVDGLADPANNRAKLTRQFGEVDVSGVRRAVNRIKQSGGN